MKWNKFDKKLDFDYDKQYLFAKYCEKNNIYLYCFAGTIMDAISFRKYEIENEWTHFIELEKPE